MSLIVKGQKADLTKGNPGISTVIVGMGWNSPPGVDLDMSAFALNGQGKVTGDEDLIFYGNPSGASGSIVLAQSDKRAYEGVVDREQVAITVRSVPSLYEKIAFTLTIYESEQRKQSFSQVSGAWLRLIDPATGKVLVRYNLENSFSVETAIVVGEVYRYNGEWKFNAIGSGYAGGLAALCGSFGIEVKDEPASSAPPSAPPAPPAPSPAPPKAEAPKPASPSPVNLSKIELKKKGDSINLQKNASGELGEISINLNWNQKQSTGWFGKTKGIDLDLGCLYEMADGSKGVIQALGDVFGNYNRFPYILLDGDDRTGTVKTGENLKINGNQLKEFKRIVIFAFIYQGVANWSEADGVVTIKQGGGPDIIVRLDEHQNRKGMCAIAMIKNQNNQTFQIEKQVEYFSGHRELDSHYGWGMRWVAGSK